MNDRTRASDRRGPMKLPCPPLLLATAVGLLWAVGSLTSATVAAGAPLASRAGKDGVGPPMAPTGPTLWLEYKDDKSPGNSVAEFMYFVPLISLEPVSVVESPGNTQRARMVSAKRSFAARSFSVTCEFQFAGAGSQQNIFDHTDKVRRHQQELKQGGSLDHELGSIDIEGAGCVTIEVEGTIDARVPTVTEVRIRFNGRGQPSHVTIDLHDIAYADGALRLRSESIVRVNTLIFRRRPGPAKMEITVASVRRKDAGDTFLQNVMGGLRAATANLLLKPVSVEPAGNEAMLNFGLALALGAPAYTFPRASNLKPGGT